jgi:hypothetical protein
LPALFSTLRRAYHPLANAILTTTAHTSNKKKKAKVIKKKKEGNEK